MNLREFFLKFPTEESCKAHFKAYRENVGITCKKCKCTDHKWNEKLSQYRCKKCYFKISLKSGTVMENSKLTYQYWYMAFMLITGTKKSFSALEVQRQIGHKYYEPVWAMMHKIRLTMGKRDAEYQLKDQIEMDEAFFITVPPVEKDQYGKRVFKKKKRWNKLGRAATVLVMAESKLSPHHSNEYKPNRAVKHIKMIYVDDTKISSLYPEISKNVDKNAAVVTDGANHYKQLNKLVKTHKAVKTANDKVLPWVHKTIANAKRNFLGVHHSIGKAYTQNYLNEFCFKFNRRYNGFELFDRIINTAVNYSWF